MPIRPVSADGWAGPPTRSDDEEESEQMMRLIWFFADRWHPIGAVAVFLRPPPQREPRRQTRSS